MSYIKYYKDRKGNMVKIPTILITDMTTLALDTKEYQEESANYSKMHRQIPPTFVSPPTSVKTPTQPPAPSSDFRTADNKNQIRKDYNYAGRHFFSRPSPTQESLYSYTAQQIIHPLSHQMSSPLLALNDIAQILQTPLPQKPQQQKQQNAINSSTFALSSVAKRFSQASSAASVLANQKSLPVSAEVVVARETTPAAPALTNSTVKINGESEITNKWIVPPPSSTASTAANSAIGSPDRTTSSSSVAGGKREFLKSSRSRDARKSAKPMRPSYGTSDTSPNKDPTASTSTTKIAKPSKPNYYGPK